MGWEISLAIGLSAFCTGWWSRGLGQRLPRLLVAWHKTVARTFWRWRSRYRGGRPRIDPALVELIRRMCLENPTWGAPRIHGELLKLGFSIAQSTVSRYMIPRSQRPSPGWKAFLDGHADEIAAIDMLTVTGLGFRRLYALVVLGHGRRHILHIEVTDHATAPWLARQLVEAFPWETAPTYLVRDNDGAYGLVFRQQLAALGIRDHPTMPYSPWQNGYVERLIGSIRRECLDYRIITSQGHLRRVLKAYAAYYNNDRTHLGLGKDTPNSRALETEGGIVAEPVLGGLHHRYRRRAPIGNQPRRL